MRISRKKLLRLLLALVCASPLLAAAELVSTEFRNASESPERLEVRLHVPADTAPPAKRPAVVILHHGGGWNFQSTRPYAELLSANGFITAEPILFNDRPLPSHLLVPRVFAALQLLAARPDVDVTRIGVMGLSTGGMQSIYALTEWATTTYGKGVRFAAAVSLYPGCWILKRYYTNELGAIRNPNYPEDFLKKFTAAPLLILAAGKDDYDNRNPGMCQDAVDRIPDARQRTATRVHVFPDATHGWDHGRTYSFQEPLACEGRGCLNTNRSDPGVTEQGRQQVLTFFRAHLLAER